VSWRFLVAKLLDYAADEQALEQSANPFASVALAHLKAVETKADPAARRHWKLRLVKGLYQRGWQAEEVRQLFRVIDWLIDLPEELQNQFKHEVYRYEEGRHMPYLSSLERDAMEKGMEKGIEKGREAELLELLTTELESKFGMPGKRLVAKLKAGLSVQRLRALFQAIRRAETLTDVRCLIR